MTLRKPWWVDGCMVSEIDLKAREFGSYSAYVLNRNAIPFYSLLALFATCYSEIDIFNESLPNCSLRNFVQNARLTIGYYLLYFLTYVDKRQFAGLYVYRAGQCLDELGFWRFIYH